MRTVTWPAVFAVLLGLVIPLQAQQGQGAVASAPEATALLRAGPLSRPGETVEFLSALPPAFPKELLPEGATVETAATSPSTTVVVSRVRRGTPFSLGDFSWKLERAGWIANGPMATGFGSLAGGQARQSRFAKAASSSACSCSPRRAAIGSSAPR
jgi:hypothetical protein